MHIETLSYEYALMHAYSSMLSAAGFKPERTFHLLQAQFFQSIYIVFCISNDPLTLKLCRLTRFIERRTFLFYMANVLAADGVVISRSQGFNGNGTNTASSEYIYSLDLTN